MCTRCGLAGWLMMVCLQGLTLSAAGQIQSVQSGDWSASSTWLGGVVPGPGDHAVINGNHTIQIDSPVSVQQLSMSAGTLAGTNTLSVAGPFLWTGGSLGNGAVSGRVEVAGAVDLTGTGTKGLRGMTLVLNGGGVWDNGAVSLSQGGRLVVPTNQTLAVTANHPLSAQNFIGGLGFIDVFGLWQQTGTGTVVVGQSGSLVSLNQQGRLTLTEGMLQFASGGSVAGAIQIESNATVHISGGTVSVIAPSFELAGGGLLHVTGGTLGGTGEVVLSGDLHLFGGTYNVEGFTTVQGDMTFSGGVLDGGTNEFVVQGDLAWTGGSLGNSSAFGTVSVAGTTSITGSGTKSLRGKTLALNGGGSWDNGDLSLSQGGRLRNATGQTLTVTSDAATRNASNFAGGTGVIENRGVWVQPGTGLVYIGQSQSIVEFDNSGSVLIDGGTLQLGRGGSWSGVLSLADQTRFRVSGGDAILGGTNVTATGETTLEVSGGTLTLNSDLTVSEVLINGGVLNGPANLDVDGDLTVSSGTHGITGATTVGGEVSVSGGTLAAGNGTMAVTGGFTWTGGFVGSGSVTGTVSIAGNTAITGSGTKSLRGKTLALDGGGSWDNGDLSISEGGRLIVPVGETFVVSAETRRSVQNFIGGNGFIDVFGLWQQTGTGTMVVGLSGSLVSWNQLGSLSLAEGTVQFASSGSLGGVLQVSSNATVMVSGGTVAVTAPSFDLAGGGLLRLTGGTLGGTGVVTLSGDFLISGGTYSVAGPTTVQGDMTFSGGAIAGVVHPLVIEGAFIWSGGDLGNNGVTGTVSVTGLTRLIGTADKRLRGKSLLMLGGGQWEDGNINVSESGRLVVPFGQTLEVAANAFRSINNSIGGFGFVDNEGTWLQQGTGTVVVGQFGSLAQFNHRGVLLLEGGQLQVNNSGELASSSTTLTPASVLQIGGGTISMTGSNRIFGTSGVFRITGGTVIGAGNLTVTGGQVEQSGGTYGPAGTTRVDGDLLMSGGAFAAGTSVVQVVSNLYWTGGSLGTDSSSTGIMTVAGTTMMSGIAEKRIRGRHLKVTGGGVWSSGSMGISEAGRFVIPTGSVFSINATNTLNVVNLVGGIGSFENQGRLEVSVNGAVDFGVNGSLVHFFNAGTLSIAAGDVVTRIAGQHSGTMALSNGAAFHVVGGTFDFASTLVDQTGEGIVRISGGTVRLLEPTEWTRLDMSGGTVQSNALLSIGSGGLLWSGGSLGVSSVSTGLIEVAGLTTFASTAQKVLRGRTLVPNGNAVWQDGPIDVAEGGILRVPTGRQMDVQAASTRDLRNFVGGIGRVENQGLWINNGVGPVQVGPSGSIVHFINDGELRQQGGSFVSFLNFTNNGILSGSGAMSFSGVFTQNGVIAPGTSPGQLTITRASLTLPPSSEVRVELVDGSGPGTGFDQLVFAGGLQLGGTLDINDGGDAPNGTYPVIVCSNGVNCITGQFATVNLPVGANLVYESHAVSVTITGRAPRVYIVDTTTAPTGLAVVAGAGIYNEGDTVSLSAPGEVLVPPLRYTFHRFLRNGLFLSSSNATELVLSSLDSTNLLFTAEYTASRILPVVVSASTLPTGIVPARSNVTVTFRFDRVMLTNVMPMVEWIGGPTNEVLAVITNGVWTSNTTFRADSLTPSPALVGTNRLFVSLARDLEDQQMERAEILAVVIAPPLALTVTPASTSVFASSQGTFTATGGIPPYSFSLSAHPSGGSVHPFNGTYVAGAEVSVTDQILVTDAWGSNGVANVQVLPDPDPVPDLVVASVSAPATAQSGVPFEIVYVVSNRGAANAAGERQDYVLITLDGASGGEVFLAARTADEILAPGDRVIVTQAVTIGVSGPAGNLRLIVAVDANQRIAEENETNNLASAVTLTQVPFLLRMSPVSGVVTEGASLSFNLSRNGSLAAALAVNLLADLPDQLEVPTTVTIPAGVAIASFSASGVTDGVVDGSAFVEVLASAAGFPSVTSAVTVTDADVETMTLVLSTNRLVEGEVATGVVARTAASVTPLTISLSGGSGRLAFPGFVTIPAGATSTNFLFSALQNTYIETNFAVTLTANASGFSTAVAPVTVVDDDVPVVTLTLSVSSVGEAAGPQAVVGTATRNIVSTRAVNVDLFSSDPGSLQVPAGVTIPASSASAEFAVLPVDNGNLDGQRSITISGSVLGSLSGLVITSAVPASLVVTDDDGPALQLTAAKTLVGEGLDPATTLTVRRNTGTAGALTVDLVSSNPGELIAPTSVIMPDGANVTTFTVSTVADGVTDGNQPVQVLATATGFAGATLAMTVSDTTLPDLVPVFLHAPTDAMSGERIDVAFRLENTGFAPAAVGFSQRLSLSRDPIPGDDTLLTQVTFGGTLPEGGGFTQTLPVTLPTATGTFWLVLAVDALDSVGEVQEGNNTLVAAVPVLILPDYHVTVQASVEQAAAGTPVLLSGSATRTGSGAPAAFELVTIHLTLRDTVRLFSTLTDAAGNYSFLFQPLSGEAGVYTVGADHPAVATTPVQDTFTLSGFRARLLTNPRLTEGATATNVIVLENLGPIGIGALSAQVLIESGGGFSMSLDLASTALPGDGSVNLNAVITAPPGVGGQGAFRIQISSPEANTVTLDVPFVCDVLRSRLAATPSSLLVPMVRGEQVVAQFAVTNTGGAATGPITAMAPPIPWIRIVGGTTLSSLAPGESAVISLLLSPPTDLALGDHTGNIVVNGADSPLYVPFTFRALSSLSGDLRVTASDELTYYAEGAPALSNAMVTLTDAFTREQFVQTNFAGQAELLLTGLPEAYYEIQVTSPDHTPFTQTFLLVPGTENRIDAFLPRQTVRITWTVDEIEIEDRYDITVESTFEANLPIPVITVEPSIFDMADFPGETKQVDVTISNHGLLAAQNGRFEFQQSTRLAIEPLVENVGDIPAMSSITIPVIFRKLPAPLSRERSRGDGPKTMEEEGDPNCILGGAFKHTVQCAGVDVSYNWNFKTINLNKLPGFQCGSSAQKLAASSPFPHFGGNFGHCNNPPCSIGNPGYDVPIAVEKRTVCDPCVNDTLSGLIGNCMPLIPVPFDLNPFEKPETECGDGSGAVSQFINCMKDAHGNLSEQFEEIDGLREELGEYGISDEKIDDFSEKTKDGMDRASKALDILSCFAPLFDPCPFKGGVGGPVASSEGSSKLRARQVNNLSAASLPSYLLPGIEAPPVTSELAPLYAAAVDFRKQFLPGLYLLGDPAWLQGGDQLVLTNWVNNFMQTMEEISDAGAFVSANERNQLLATAYPVSVNEALVNATIDRWNRSVTNWNEGRLNLADVLPGESADVIGNDVYAFLHRQAYDATTNALAKGYQGLQDQYANVYQETLAFFNQPDDGGGVCARIRLRLEQQAVLSRTAFRAVLEVGNNVDVPIEDVLITLIIKDADGNDSTSLFQVRAPELASLSAVDGSGIIPAQSNGKATWVIVPTSDAAPTNETQHFVQGTLSYTQDGIPVTIPLEPSMIRVLPSPKLVVHYFHERDVFSDDPFTGVIEPAIPYSLGILVSNEGFGVARNFRIVSGQPEIIDNEKGLLIDFELFATEVGGQGLSPSLTADFGDVDSGDIVMARWLFKSSLQGLFIDYEATFEHIDGLGDARLSLIDRLEIHEMRRVVKADGAFEDGLVDFLVNDVPDLQDLPDTLWFSNGGQAPVVARTNGVGAGTITPSQLTATLTVNLATGWNYLLHTDPASQDYELVEVRRSDNSTVDLAFNVWRTDRTFIGLSRRPRNENRLHLIDHAATNGLQTYTLIYQPSGAGQDTTPPVSSVSALAGASPSTFVVNWSGSDGTNGSGLAFFDIYVAIDGGAFSNWISGAPAGGAVFEGQPGVTYAFYSRATDNEGNVEPEPLAAQAQTQTALVNTMPTLTYDAVVELDEGGIFRIAPVFSDADVPAQALVFSIAGGLKPGMTLDPASGQLVYPTGEATGPSTNLVLIRLTDDGIAALSVTAAVSLVVREINQTPSLPAAGPFQLVGETSLVFTVTATDNDRPVNTLTYGLASGAPAGVSFGGTNGLFQWIPSLAQIPGDYEVGLVVTDNGTPPLSATQVVRIATRLRPVITWANPAPLAVGSVLSGVQLNAAADAPGTFSYSPPAGALLPLGLQTLTTVFTPSEPASHVAVTATVQVLVEPAPQSITFAPIPDQFTTNRVILAATASSGLPVSFRVEEGPALLEDDMLTFTGPGEVVVVAEQGGAAVWQVAIPVTNRFLVRLTPMVINWEAPAPALVGTVLGPDQLNAAAAVPGDFTYDPAEGTVLPDGTNVLQVTLTPSNAALYATSTGTVHWIIEPYLRIQAGQVVLRRGESGLVPFGIEAAGGAYTAGVGRISFRLDAETNRFSAFALEVDPVVATLGTAVDSNQFIEVTVEAKPGQRLAHGIAAVQLAVTMPLAQTSGVVVLRVLDANARDRDGGEIFHVFGEPGRAVLVGDQPIFDAPERADGMLRIPVFMAPGQWMAERARELGPDSIWEPISSLDDVNLITNVTVETDTEPLRIFRMRKVQP